MSFLQLKRKTLILKKNELRYLHMRCKYSSAQETYFEFIHVLQAMRMISRQVET